MIGDISKFTKWQESARASNQCWYLDSARQGVKLWSLGEADFMIYTSNAPAEYWPGHARDGSGHFAIVTQRGDLICGLYQGDVWAGAWQNHFRDEAHILQPQHIRFDSFQQAMDFLFASLDLRPFAFQ